MTTEAPSVSLDDLVLKDKKIRVKARVNKQKEAAAAAKAKAAANAKKTTPAKSKNAGVTKKQPNRSVQQQRGGGPMRGGPSRGRGGPPRGSYGGYAGYGAPGYATPPMMAPAAAPVVSNANASKILLSNLDSKVSDADMKDLFGVVGPLKFARVNYDSNGKSLGTAEINFSRKGDANKAFDKYNGFALDGKIMKMIVVNDQPQSVPVSQRLTGSPQPMYDAYHQGYGMPYGDGGMDRRGYNNSNGPVTRQRYNSGGYGGMGMGNMGGNQQRNNNNKNNTRNAVKKTSQKGAPPTKGAATKTSAKTPAKKVVKKVVRQKKEKPTAEQLDKEMEAYMNQGEATKED